MRIFDELGNTFAVDLAKLILGDKLGEGMSREVYEFAFDKKFVVKVEQSKFQNVREWELWNELKENKLAKHFAPCVDISPCGIYLIQRRTEPIPKSEYPEKIPHFFTDEKFSNFGVIVENGKKSFVCHDYGSFILTNGFRNGMKKAVWWE